MEINGTEIMTEWDKEEIQDTFWILLRLLKMRGLIDQDIFEWEDIEKQVKEFEEMKEKQKEKA